MMFGISFKLDFPCGMDKYSSLCRDLKISVNNAFVSQGYEQDTRQP